MPKGRFERTKEQLAANVYALRLQQGLSQQKLADAASLDLKHVQKIEYGQLNPTLRTLTNLAVALSVSVGELVDATRPIQPRRQVGRPTGRAAKK